MKKTIRRTVAASRWRHTRPSTGSLVDAVESKIVVYRSTVVWGIVGIRRRASAGNIRFISDPFGTTKTGELVPSKYFHLVEGPVRAHTLPWKRVDGVVGEREGLIQGDWTHPGVRKKFILEKTAAGAFPTMKTAMINSFKRSFERELSLKEALKIINT